MFKVSKFGAIIGAATPTTRMTAFLQKVQRLPLAVPVLVAQLRQIVWLQGRMLFFNDLN